MTKGAVFIQENFTRLELLKGGPSGTTEIVRSQDKQIYVRKIIPYTGLPYKLLAKLQHPAIPLLYYVAETDKATYVLEEYISGQNLQEHLATQGPLSEKEVTRIAIQLCQVLTILHAHKILHRDIKPENIILRDDNTIKLIDFGAARLAAPGQRHDTHILGTEGYAPPEQYGFAPTDIRSDLYALGVTIKTLLGPDYHGRLLKLAGYCTQLDPEQRIVSAAALQAMLEGKTWLGKKQLLAAVLVLLFGTGGYYVWQRSSPAPAQTPTTPAAEETRDTSRTSSVVNQESPLYFPFTKNASPGKQRESLLPEIPTENQADSRTSSPLSPAAKQIVGGQASTSLSNSGWSYARIALNDDRPQLAYAAKRAKQLGYTLVEKAIHSNDTVFSVTNTSGVPLQNPQVEFILNDFGVEGTDSKIEIEPGIWEICTFSAGSNKEISQKITIRMQGNIAPGDTRNFSFASGVDLYYLMGPSPTFHLVFSADNARTQQGTLPIRIRKPN